MIRLGKATTGELQSNLRILAGTLSYHELVASDTPAPHLVP